MVPGHRRAGGQVSVVEFQSLHSVFTRSMLLIVVFLGAYGCPAKEEKDGAPSPASQAHERLQRNEKAMGRRATQRDPRFEPSKRYSGYYRYPCDRGENLKGIKPQISVKHLEDVDRIDNSTRAVVLWVACGPRCTERLVDRLRMVPAFEFLDIIGPRPTGKTRRSGLLNGPAREATRFLFSSKGLATLPTLAGLSVSAKEFNDADLRELRHVRNLKSLGLFGTSVTGVGFAVSTNLSSLEELDLTCASASDEGLGHFKHLANLRRLILTSNRVGDHGIRRLPSLPRLKSLSLTRTAVTDVGVAIVPEKFPSLEVLSLDYLRITDRSCGYLRPLDHLRSLVLSSGLPNHRLTNGCLESLGFIHTIERLMMGYTKITSSGLVLVDNLEELREFSAPFAPIDDWGLLVLAQHHGIVALDLTGTRITDRGLRYLEGRSSELGDLEYLNIADTLVTQKAVRRVRQRWPKIKIISDFD